MWLWVWVEERLGGGLNVIPRVAYSNQKELFEMDVLFNFQFTCFPFSILCQETLKGRRSSVNLIEPFSKYSETNLEHSNSGKWQRLCCHLVASAEFSVNECITNYTSASLKTVWKNVPFIIYISFFLFPLF